MLKKPALPSWGDSAGLRRGAGSNSAPVSLQVRLLVLAGFMLLAVLGCNYLRSDFDKQTFFASVRPAPGDTERILNNARYYKLWGRPEMAMKELEMAYRDNPDNLKIADALARNCEEVGDYKRAREIYQACLDRHPANQSLQNNLCYSYYQEGRLDQAEACFRETLARNPQNQMARNNLGLLLCRLGRQDAAHRLWQEAEGEAAAQAKMTAALKVLGKDASGYARSTLPPRGQAATAAPAPAKVSAPQLSHSPVSKPVMQPEINTVAAAVPKAQVQPQPPATQRQLASLQQAEADAAIEVRNGTRTRHLARRTQRQLAQDGFHIRCYGNHRNFGAKKTMILYRPEAEKVARTLSDGHFPTAELQLSDNLRKNTDVKIILGADFAKRWQMLASLARN